MATDHPLLGRSLLVLTAHPDDEAFTAGGTIHANGEAGGRTVLLCASLGGRGRAHLDRELTDEELKRVRFDELHAATGCLGMHEVHVFDFPDGELAGCQDDIRAQWEPLVARIEPDAILSFGPDGYTGHADHVAVGEIAAGIARERGLPLWRFALPDGEFGPAFRECLQRKRAHGIYADALKEAGPDRVCVHVRPERKLEALRHHASQFGGLDPYRVFPPEIAEHFLTHEYFTRQRLRRMRDQREGRQEGLGSSSPRFA